MEIKHTVEILTKDIQEIEKLVRNLNNSPTPSRIELDLALDKLRNVYELLSMIRSDAEWDASLKHKENAEELTFDDPNESSAEESRPEEQALYEEVSPEDNSKKSAGPDHMVNAPAEEEATQHETASTEKEQSTQEESSTPEKNKTAPEKKKKEAAILAEKFTNDPSLNENMASKSPKSDLSSKITTRPIDNIGRHIGINDRFLIIRELLDGDNEAYAKLITDLDDAGNSEEGLEILSRQFPENEDHEAYLLLTHLVKRKHLH